MTITWQVVVLVVATMFFALMAYGVYVGHAKGKRLHAEAMKPPCTMVEMMGGYSGQATSDSDD